MENNLILNTDNIKNKIYTLRGVQVMLDNDLAELYHVSVKALNQAVKRNINRFPEKFMFQLSKKEAENWLFKSKGISSRSQIVTLKKGENVKYLPYAFTEQGVAMLSGILKSDTAVRISIQIMDVFVSMRKFISSNAQIFNRMDIMERKQIEHDEKIDQLFDAIESKGIKPEKGIFFDEQIFDAYKFVSDIVRTAEKSIVLIDNYIDDSVLTLFTKRNKNVNVTIFTKEISKQLYLDLTKYNSQYAPIEIKEFKKSHDRFLIIDNKEVYHFGASLKDLGKKWFAFSKFEKESFNLIGKLGLED